MAKESLSVKIKVLDTKAVLPKYAKDGDAGMDLTAIDVSTDQYGCFIYHNFTVFAMLQQIWRARRSCTTSASPAS